MHILDVIDGRTEMFVFHHFHFFNYAFVFGAARVSGDIVPYWHSIDLCCWIAFYALGNRRSSGGGNRVLLRNWGFSWCCGWLCWSWCFCRSCWLLFGYRRLSSGRCLGRITLFTGRCWSLLFSSWHRDLDLVIQSTLFFQSI